MLVPHNHYVRFDSELQNQKNFPNFLIFVPRNTEIRRFWILTPYEVTPREAFRAKNEVRKKKWDEIGTKPGHDDWKARAAENVVWERERGGAPRRAAGSSMREAERHIPASPKSPTVTSKTRVYIDANRRLTLFAVDRMDVGESANAPYPYFPYVFISGGNSKSAGTRRGPEEVPKREPIDTTEKGSEGAAPEGHDRKTTREVYLMAWKRRNRRNRATKPYNHCNVIE